MTTNALPKISVVTVSFNHAEFIKKNIESVLGQNYPNVEHIIVDGGSTDATLDILKGYPHLKWTSAPDNGQSDALNKGFSRATGDIIVWLNSDDWLADNVFHEIAQKLEEYPVVLGQAAQTDRDGNVTSIVQNPAKSFYDLLRYWVPLAWVAQTSVFFKRSVLEEMKRPDGTYVDQDLFFTMDLDLWFRIAMKYPFVRHINRVLSYFRIYDSNKTGARPHATQKECCRVYRRHINGLNPTEHRLTYILPMSQPTELCKETLVSLTAQTCLDFDIMIVDYAADRMTSKAVHDLALDFCEAIPQITVRYAKSIEPNEYAAFNTGVIKATAPNVAFIQPGDTIAPETTHEALRILASDPVGLVIPHGLAGVNAANFFPAEGQINIAEFIGGQFFYPNLFARRLALLELETFRHIHNPGLALRELLTRLIFKCWAIQSGPSVRITPHARNYSNEITQYESNKEQTIKQVLESVKRDFEHEPFAEQRAAIRDPRPLFANL